MNIWRIVVRRYKKCYEQYRAWMTSRWRAELVDLQYRIAKIQRARFDPPHPSRLGHAFSTIEPMGDCAVSLESRLCRIAKKLGISREEALTGS